MNEERTIDTNEVCVVQDAWTEERITRAAKPEATPEEVTASMSSCVVHLCGCK